MTTIILASGSQWRRQLLLDIGLDVTAISAKIIEEEIWGRSPLETATLRAQAKANEVLSRHPSALVIGADQVCHFQGKTIGKPASDSEWLDRLMSMRGQEHSLTTAVAIRSDEHEIDFYESTKVYFRNSLTKDVLQRYIALNEARNCAGGYMMEKRGAWLIERIEGDWQNVIGLPIFSLTHHLRSIGIGFFGESNG